MTPQEALNTLDQVAQQYQADRATHIQLQIATSVLQGTIERAAQAEEADKIKKSAEAVDDTEADNKPAKAKKA